MMMHKKLPSLLPTRMQFKGKYLLLFLKGFEIAKCPKYSTCQQKLASRNSSADSPDSLSEQTPGILHRIHGIQRIHQKCSHPGLTIPWVLHAPRARMTVVNINSLKLFYQKTLQKQSSVCFIIYENIGNYNF